MTGQSAYHISFTSIQTSSMCANANSSPLP